MALKGVVLLALVLSVSSENTRLKEVFSWQTVEYVFPKESDRADAIKSGVFVPDNNLPLGLDVWKDKLFITVPRWKSGVVSSLNYIDISGVEIPCSEELEEEPTEIIEIEPGVETPVDKPEEPEEDNDGGLDVEDVGNTVGDEGVLGTGDGDLPTGNEDDGGLLGGVGDLVTGGDGDGPLDAVGGLLTGDNKDNDNNGLLGSVSDLVTGGDGDGPLDAVGGLLTGDNKDNDNNGLLGSVSDLVTGGDGDGPLDAVGGLLTGDNKDNDNNGLLGSVSDLVTGGDGDGPLDAVGGLLTGDNKDNDNNGLLGSVGDLVTGGDGDGPLDAVGGLLTGDNKDNDNNGLLGSVSDLVTGGDGDGALDAVGGLLTGDNENNDNNGLLGSVSDLVTGGDGDGPLDAVGGLLTGSGEDKVNEGLLSEVGDQVTGGEKEDSALDTAREPLPGDDLEGDEDTDTSSEAVDEDNEGSEEPSSSEEEESPDKRINSGKRNSFGEKKYQRVKRSIAGCSGEDCEDNRNSIFLLRKRKSKEIKLNEGELRPEKKTKKTKKTKKAKKKTKTTNLTDDVQVGEKGSKKTPSRKEQAVTKEKNKRKDKNVSATKKEKKPVKKPINSTGSKKVAKSKKKCRDIDGNPCGIPPQKPVYAKPILRPPKKSSKKKKKCKKICCQKACVKPAKVSTTSPALVPYPDLATNTPAKDATDTKITSVFRVRVDICDRLWVMDTGIADILGNTVEYSKPQILIYDLNTDKIVRKYVFKSEDIQEHSFFANVVVDADKTKCDESFAYVPDLGSYAIVVYDLKKDKAWRIKHHYFHFNPLEGNYNVGGENFQWTDGVFGIALTRPNPDKSRTAYFHALSSYSEFMVNTFILQNEQEGKESNYTAYELVGNKGPNSQTSASFIHEPTGVMFYTQVNKNAIFCWNTDKPFKPENLEEVASDSSTMVFPNDLKVDFNNNLWVLTDKLPVFVIKGLDSKQINYRIFVSPVSQAIKDTNCAP